MTLQQLLCLRPDLSWSRSDVTSKALSVCSSSGPAAAVLGQKELPEAPQGWHGGAAGLPGSAAEESRGHSRQGTWLGWAGYRAGRWAESREVGELGAAGPAWKLPSREKHPCGAGMCGHARGGRSPLAWGHVAGMRLSRPRALQTRSRAVCGDPVGRGV